MRLAAFLSAYNAGLIFLHNNSTCSCIFQKFCVPLHSISDYTEAQLKEKMCDYVRHEVSEMLKRGEEIKP